VVRLGPAARPGHRSILHGRRGTWRYLCALYVAGVARHPPALCVAGVRGTSRRPPTFCVAGGTYATVLGLAALCVAGLALGDIHLHFAWQAWHLATFTCTLRGKRGTWRHRPSFGVAGVALGDIQAASESISLKYHFVTRNFVTHNLSHLSLSLSHTSLSHTTLSHTTLSHATLSHTTLSHTTLYIFVTDNLSHTTLSHTIFHTQLCHTQLCHTTLSHTTLSRTSLSYTTLSHTQLFHTQLYTTLSQTIFHTQLCHTHTQSFTHSFVTNSFVIHNSFTHNLSHTTLSHTQLCHTQLRQTHNLSDTSLSHTTLHIQRLKCSFLQHLLCPFFFLRAASTTFSDYWKKLTCGVIRSVNLFLLFLIAACTLPAGKLQNAHKNARKYAQNCANEHKFKKDKFTKWGPNIIPKTVFFLNLVLRISEILLVQAPKHLRLCKWLFILLVIRCWDGGPLIYLSEQDNPICHERFFKNVLILLAWTQTPNSDLFCVRSSRAEI